jgi:cobalt-zinc-cadmium efflux system membrane fusion protein
MNDPTNPERELKPSERQIYGVRYTQRQLRAAVTAAVGLVCLIGLYQFAFKSTPPASSGAAAAPAVATRGADSVRVTAKQLQQIQIRVVEARAFRVQKPAVGQIAFNEDASTPVVAPFSGRVTRLTARTGDQVRRGDPLFEIESPEVVQAQNDLISAAQAVEKTKAQLSLARQALERAKDLYEARAGSRRDLEQAQNGYANAEIDQRTSVGNLAAARNRLRVLGRGAAEIARVENERVVNPIIAVVSPIDGTVVARKVGPGQYVRADNTDPLYLIADLGTMWLRANVSENDIALIRSGQEVEVKVNAFPDRAFKARITSIGAASDPVTHRVVVRSEIANPDGLLKPEMFARYRIDTGVDIETPAVPVDAIVREPEVITCWIEIEPGLFQRRKVQLGIEQDGYLQILEGVQAGEKVAARGAIFLDNAWQE